MAMQKYTTSEKFEVLRGEAADVLNKTRQRLGKASLADFTEKELKDLEEDLSRFSGEGGKEKDDGDTASS